MQDRKSLYLVFLKSYPLGSRPRLTETVLIIASEFRPNHPAAHFLSLTPSHPSVFLASSRGVYRECCKYVVLQTALQGETVVVDVSEGFLLCCMWLVVMNCWLSHLVQSLL